MSVFDCPVQKLNPCLTHIFVNVILLGQRVPGALFCPIVSRPCHLSYSHLTPRSIPIQSQTQGLTVDVATNWYSLASEPNPNWSDRFSGRDEIWAYQKDVVDRTGLRAHLRTNVMLVGAAWDAARSGYELQLERTVSDPSSPYSGGAVTKSGDVEVVFVNFLITANGGSWSLPKFPTPEEFPGLNDFKGEVFHTAAWRTDVDLKGKRVGVIGNGATGAQLVPALAKEPTTQVINIARTPQWFIERVNSCFSSRCPWNFRHADPLLTLFDSKAANLPWTNQEMDLQAYSPRTVRCARVHLPFRTYASQCSF